MVEGPGLLAEAVAGGYEIEAVFVPAGATVPTPGERGGAPLFELAPGVLEKVATTEHPQPLLAVVRQKAETLDDLAGARFVVVLAGVGDPGNAGTILRCAEAAGADGVVVTAGSVDLSNPKSVRASAGARFHVPVVEDVPVGDLARLGLPLVGAVADDGLAYTEGPLDQPLALVLGGEAHGIPADLPLDVRVHIPHRGRAESLNVAMAAAVLCFEVARRSS